MFTDTGLLSFWIVPPTRYGSRGFGVTAVSLADALTILKEAGYELPEDTSKRQVTAKVQASDLDQTHVACNMGPITVRGIWHPLTKVGT